MKKHLFVGVALCSALLFLFIMRINLFETQAQGEWDVPGVYPVSSEDEEWEKMDMAEALAALTMPEEKLRDLSTEDLLMWVMKYPFLADVAVHDFPENGIEMLNQTSNICHEFFSRNDAKKQLIDFYLSLNYDELDRLTRFRYKTFFNAYFSSCRYCMNEEEISIVKKIDQIQKEAGVTALNALLLDKGSYEETISVSNLADK